ncbi:MAG: hypothetical protein ACD_12C00672G0003 [uncultured bacterium]|nr:MAG: hypothetical protein ACD_12C00672G0003 [uncultured bacterium]KKQ79686.1 MAG: hypothetical protein UT02_C0027G0006 [Parcubacteria group bacterium GW2011_GWC2_38_7]
MQKSKKIILIISILVVVSYLYVALIAPKFVDLEISDFITNDSTPEPAVLYSNQFNFQPACALVGGEINEMLVGIGVERSFCKITNKLICSLRGGKYYRESSVNQNKQNIEEKSCIKE